MGALFVGMTVISVRSLPWIAGQAPAAPEFQAGLFVPGSRAFGLGPRG